MAGLSSLLNIARDALTAQSYGVGVAGQNISNVNTPGYVRREAILQPRVLGTQTAGGVEIAGLRRVADQFIDRRHLEASGLSSAAGERDAQLGQLEAVFNDFSGTGMGSSLDALFSSFATLASNPSDPTARQAVLERAEGFAARSRETADALAEQRGDMLEKAQSTVQEVNGRAIEIAQLNRQIAMAEAQGEDAADLKDRRNQLLLDLSSKVDIRTFSDGAGSIVVQAAGTTLVEGANARSFSIDLAGDGSMRLLAARENGPTMEVTQSLSGGKLAGIFEARDSDLAATITRFDQFVYDVATAINTQHAAGFGLDGVSGRALFSITPGPAGAGRAIVVDPAVAGNPSRIAAASSAGTVPGGSDNAAALARLASQPITSGATQTAAQGYGSLVGDVGLRKASAAAEVSLRGDVEAQIAAMRESVSGVSLDEEMVNLTKYQRAYEAAAKVLTTVDELLQELLARIGR
jgi:flagellar hook-associated protein 1